MIVILSDLHFSEAQSTKIGDLEFNRNLPADTYQAYFEDLNQAAVENEIKRIDLVLAGDILELSRSGIWLDGEGRPYIDNKEVLPESNSEKVILQIIQAISQEDKVAETLAIIRNIQDYFDVDVKVHYLLGNHDRLANATPAIRQQVRRILGLEVGEGGQLFPPQYIGLDSRNRPFCLVRHGHEYDPMNFPVNTHLLEEIPTDFPDEVYGSACLGDITTIEFGAALPNYFVEIYGEEEILQDPTLMALYERLMAFDDVRPTTALLAYLFSTPGVEKKRTWELMEPCFTKAIQVITENEQFQHFLKHSSSLKSGQRILLRVILNSGLFSKMIPYWLIKRVMTRVSMTINLQSQSRWAKREALIRNKASGCKCVVSGHTHFPEVSLISSEEGEERYYINTGTWRNLIPATKDFDEFGTLRSMTRAIVFRPEEDAISEDKTQWSFQYLSGYSFGNYRHF
jgi:UDP-2,3-diacylglucosamine pyrophosphatase LpxH